MTDLKIRVNTYSFLILKSIIQHAMHPLDLNVKRELLAPRQPQDQ